MKKLFFCLVSVFVVICLQYSSAQGVSISPSGASPDQSAGLDINFTNKGVLIPRVHLASDSDVVTIASPAFSLLVYNNYIGGSGLSTSGFYYFDGKKWQLISSSANSTSSATIQTAIAPSNNVYPLLAGVIDGSNKTFTVPTSYISKKLIVFYNGVAQSGFVETNPSSGIFTLNFAPQAGDELLIQYAK